MNDNQTKPGAMVLVPRERIEYALKQAENGLTGPESPVRDACSTLRSILAEQPPAVGGELVPLTVWYGSMPESNGRSNFTAILHRKGGCMSEGICIDRSEYPERTRYEADRMRHLIGELADEPDILAYDPDKHSGYVRQSLPATAKVVLPERKGQKHTDWRQWTEKEMGWNACLDEVAKLNGGA